MNVLASANKSTWLGCVANPNGSCAGSSVSALGGPLTI